MNGHVAGSSHALARRRAQSNSLDPYATRWAFRGSNADLDIAAESREKTHQSFDRVPFKPVVL